MSEETIYKKVWHILTPAQHKKTLLLFVLMVLGMLLEMLGLSLVIPVLAIISQSDLAYQYPFLKPLLQYLGNPSTYELVIFSLLILALVYTIKALFLGFLAWQQAKFSFAVSASISQRLFNNYLRHPYTFHLQHNSAQLIQNVANEASIFNNVTQSALIILTDGLIFIGITALLLFIEPIGALFVITILGMSGWVFYKFTRKLIHSWGEARKFHEGLRMKHLQQGLGGAKDVKLLGRETEFLDQFRTHNFSSAKVGELQTTVRALPRYWLELLAVLGLLTLMLVMIKLGKPMDSLVPMLGLFAAAAFRVMPSINRVLSAFQGLRYALPVIEMLYKELHLIPAFNNTERQVPLTVNNSIELKNISFFYPACEAPTINNISISIPCGSMTGFIGTTGAGKTTLVDIILGLLTPTSGAVSVDNINIQTNIRGWQDQIGYVAQSIFLTDDTLRRNVAFGLSNEKINETAVWKAIRAAQLESFVNELPQGLDTVVGERGIRLSGGQRQRIGIARALYHDPQVLVMDEATSFLDTETERGVMDAVNSMHGSKTILIITHRLSTVENCDQLYCLEKGVVVDEGSPNSILFGNETISSS